MSKRKQDKFIVEDSYSEETNSDSDYNDNPTEFETESYISESESFVEKDEKSINKRIFDKLSSEIYNGDFFRINVFDKSTTDEEFVRINNVLIDIKKDYTNTFNLKNIIDKKSTLEEKKYILEQLYTLSNCELFSTEYYQTIKIIKNFLNDDSNILSDKDILISKVENLNISEENKKHILKKIDTMFSYKSHDSSEYIKCKNWVNSILSIPFGKYTKHVPKLLECREILDSRLSFLEKPKDTILNLIGQKLQTNINSTINAIGICGPPGTGKCHGIGTKILMYNGIFKYVEDIIVGDILLGDDNTPRKVLTLGRGIGKIYKVTTSSGYDSFTVNEDHILCLYNIEKDCEEEITVKDYLSLLSLKTNYRGYSKSIEFKEKPVPIDPFIVGLWLNGLKYKFSSLSQKDKTTLLIILQNNLPRGCYVFVRNNLLHITGKFIKELTNIPSLYKYNSKKIRHEILKGINFLPFDNTNNNIDASDLHFLKRSLYDETFKIDISYSYYGDYYGFTLDSNNRYLLDNFIVTHNTSIVECIAKSLGREYFSISLGGETDSSNLIGHNFTYVGSTSGKIINVFKNAKTMDPVILIDELDKTNSKDIINILIHLTDPSTNHRYNIDKYFGDIYFDLSKAIYIFTFNNKSKVDKILLDRLNTIHINDYTNSEKLAIIIKHILPNLVKQFGLSKLVFEKDFLDLLIKNTSSHTGLRQIKTKLHTIISRINLLKLSKSEKECDKIIKLGYKKYFDYYSKNDLVIRSHYYTLLEAFKDNSESINSLIHHSMYT